MTFYFLFVKLINLPEKLDIPAVLLSTKISCPSRINAKIVKFRVYFFGGFKISRVPTRVFKFEN
jgi:hypothetical protein